MKKIQLRLHVYNRWLNVSSFLQNKFVGPISWLNNLRCGGGLTLTFTAAGGSVIVCGICPAAERASYKLYMANTFIIIIKWINCLSIPTID